MTQRSSSVRLPHSVQKRTRAFTSSIAAASASASSFGRESRWNARRCAVRCPTPGSLVSCATRLSTAGDSTVTFCPQPPVVGLLGLVPQIISSPAARLCLAARRSPCAWRGRRSGRPPMRSAEGASPRAESEAGEGLVLEPETERAQVSELQLRLRELLRRLQRGVHRCQHEILERLHVLRVDRLFRDLDLDELAGARCLDGDRSAARGPLDDLVLHLLLRLLHLLLHLLGLLHQLAEVHAHDSSTSLASKVSLTSW